VADAGTRSRGQSAAQFQVQDEPTGSAVVVASTRPSVVQAGGDTSAPQITTIGVGSAWSYDSGATVDKIAATVWGTPMIAARPLQ
jgi:hypothetical protein